MKTRLYVPLLGIVLMLFIFPNSSGACPKCFAATAKPVLNAYYVSIAFMSLIPVGIVGAILTWLHRQNRQTTDQTQ
ncbi:MAG: hypothetical protein ALAOOOJD_04347 [bacterium]|nr:hypothetical protein [bacterium]